MPTPLQDADDQADFTMRFQMRPCLVDTCNRATTNLQPAPFAAWLDRVNSLEKEPDFLRGVKEVRGNHFQKLLRSVASPAANQMEDTEDQRSARLQARQILITDELRSHIVVAWAQPSSTQLSSRAQLGFRLGV